MRSKSSTEYFWYIHKKWYIQGELFGLTKKKLATVIVGLVSLEKRRLKINAASEHTRSCQLYQSMNS